MYICIKFLTILQYFEIDWHKKISMTTYFHIDYTYKHRKIQYGTIGRVAW